MSSLIKALIICESLLYGSTVQLETFEREISGMRGCKKPTCECFGEAFVSGSVSASVSSIRGKDDVPYSPGLSDEVPSSSLIESTVGTPGSKLETSASPSSFCTSFTAAVEGASPWGEVTSSSILILR